MFLVDCGATGDFISEKFIKENGLNSRSSILKPGLKVVLPDGKEYVSEKILRTAELEDSEKRVLLQTFFLEGGM